MESHKENELNSIKKKILITQVIGAPDAILLGLGLYGIFGANGDAFHHLLNDKNFAESLVIIGVIIEIWQFYVLFPLFKKQASLKNNKNT